MSSTPNSLVFTGHGLPMRIPFHITPTMRHVIEFEFIDDGTEDPVDQDGTTWTAAVHDAITGAVVAGYDIDIDDNVVTLELDETDTELLDPVNAYEVRIVRTSPGPDMIAAGPVLFVADTVPAP